MCNKDFNKNFDPKIKVDKRLAKQSQVPNVDFDEEFQKLNPMQKKFVEYYLQTGDKKNSAKAAGYSVSTAGQIGKIMAETPKIKAIIDHKRKEAASVAKISKEKMLIDLENARLQAVKDKDNFSLIKLTSEIGKLQGYYEHEDTKTLDILKTGKIKITFGDKNFNANKKIDKSNIFGDGKNEDDTKWDYKMEDENENDDFDNDDLENDEEGII